jgi:hypothetical protein
MLRRKWRSPPSTFPANVSEQRAMYRARVAVQTHVDCCDQLTEPSCLLRLCLFAVASLYVQTPSIPSLSLFPQSLLLWRRLIRSWVWVWCHGVTTSVSF